MKVRVFKIITTAIIFCSTACFTSMVFSKHASEVNTTFGCKIFHWNKLNLDLGDVHVESDANFKFKSGCMQCHHTR